MGTQKQWYLRAGCPYKFQQKTVTDLEEIIWVVLLQFMYILELQCLNNFHIFNLLLLSISYLPI